MDKLVQTRANIAKCEKFSLRNQIRSTVNDFFDEMRAELDKLQRKKMEDINKVLKETSFVNVSMRAKEIEQRADLCE
jgi:hypothetical protein